jgi:hypothetical protein
VIFKCEWGSNAAGKWPDEASEYMYPPIEETIEAEDWWQARERFLTIIVRRRPNMGFLDAYSPTIRVTRTFTDEPKTNPKRKRR